MDALRTFIEDHCIYRVRPGERAIPSKIAGRTYDWQFYLRRALLDGRHLHVIAREFWTRLGPLYEQSRFQIAGLETAATPLVTALVMQRPDVNAFLIRKERKEYGLLNRLEGNPSDRPVLLVDDLISPAHHAFATAAHELLMRDFSLVAKTFVVVNKQYRSHPKTASLHIGSHPVDIVSLFTLDDFAVTWDEYFWKHKKEPPAFARLS